ncbi:alpha/beta fold hydrolase [Vulgatibacter incomptus]|uniref:alpha/beta fold hydrolase n=1 Tax=Vulgatibacter incomptus TaxID=1391653 RepID=UPI00067FAE47|nr:alpha/beta hydrolase [Vulgatibacter incomptus]
MEDRVSENEREGYVTAEDGTRLWYRKAGSGPVLVCQNGVGVTITFWEQIAERFAAQGYSTLLWDYRGHGRSDDPRNPKAFTLETCVEDLRLLLDRLGVERACLLGHSMGAQLGWEFYRAHPERVSGLVPALGTYRDAISTFYDLPWLAPRIFDVASVTSYAFPGLVKRLTGIPAWQPGLADRVIRKLSIVHPTLSPKDWVPGYLRHMARLDPKVFFALAKGIRDHDATDLLPRIDVPVLVVAGDRDLFCPPRVAREMAELIPSAELLVIPGGSHAALIEQPGLVDLRLRRFLRERVFPNGAAAHARLTLHEGGRAAGSVAPKKDVVDTAS